MYGLNRLRKKSFPRTRKVGTGFKGPQRPVEGDISGHRPRSELLAVSPVSNAGFHRWIPISMQTIATLATSTRQRWSASHLVCSRRSDSVNVVESIFAMRLAIGTRSISDSTMTAAQMTLAAARNVMPERWRQVIVSPIRNRKLRQYQNGITVPSFRANRRVACACAESPSFSRIGFTKTDTANSVPIMSPIHIVVTMPRMSSIDTSSSSDARGMYTDSIKHTDIYVSMLYGALTEVSRWPFLKKNRLYVPSTPCSRLSMADGRARYCGVSPKVRCVPANYAAAYRKSPR